MSFYTLLSVKTPFDPLQNENYTFFDVLRFKLATLTEYLRLINVLLND